jgi:hypothetical protein
VSESTVPSSTWDSVADVFTVCKGANLHLFSAFFENRTYPDLTTLQSVVSSLALLKVGSIQVEEPSEKGIAERMLSVIKLNFQTSENDDDRVKMSEIAEVVALGMGVDNDTAFSNRLERCMLTAGFKRKMFPNGLCFYGMKRKVNQNLNRDISNIDLDTLNAERNSELLVPAESNIGQLLDNSQTRHEARIGKLCPISNSIASFLDDTNIEVFSNVTSRTPMATFSNVTDPNLFTKTVSAFQALNFSGKSLIKN